MKPLQLVTLSGGLGNQMFQYAFLLHLRHKGGRVFPYFGKIRQYGEHNGYELERVFGIRLSPSEQAMDRVLSLPVAGQLVRHVLFPFKYRERSLCDYDANAALARRHAATRFTGYWQSERFFADVADEVRRVFRFDLTRLNEKSRRLAQFLADTPSTVSLHVRRGDYFFPDGSPTFLAAAMRPDYYDAAIDFLVAATGNPVRAFVFTDDADWCRAHFPADFTVVDWNRGRDSWQDMCLMSLCRHHVVANSSFSWWAAWLDNRPGSRVVAPACWKVGCECPDSTPLSWKRL